MTQRFSQRSAYPGEPNALTRALVGRAAGRRLYNLAESNPTLVGLAWNEAELGRALGPKPGLASYEPEAFGMKEARRALAQELANLGFQVPTSQIMLTASTSEAYGFLFKLLCDPGDNMLVPTPSYPLFDVLAALENVALRPYRLAYDGEWHVDMPSVRAALNERTRAILLVHPNNPTGSYLKLSELESLAGLGLPLISDEVFAEFPYAEDKGRAASALCASSKVLVFRLSGLSKSLALPQVKLAFTAVAGPGAIAASERLAYIADTYLSVSTQVQLALPKLLESGPEMRARIRERVQANRAFLSAAVEGTPLSVLHAEGGWYAILRLPSVHDDETWALKLLEEDDVLVQPGFFYDLTEGTHVVLSLITEPQIFAEGIARLSRRVDFEATRP